MDKKYIVGLVFAVVLLGSASAVAVRVVLHGKSSIPVKGLTSSASEPAAQQPQTDTQKEAVSTQQNTDFILPVEAAVTQIELSAVPKAVTNLLNDTKDARAYSVEYANGSKGYRVERDIAQSLTTVANQWQTSLQTANVLQNGKSAADQALYRVKDNEYKIVVVISRLAANTTGQTISAVRE